MPCRARWRRCTKRLPAVSPRLSLGIAGLLQGAARARYPQGMSGRSTSRALLIGLLLLAGLVGCLSERRRIVRPDAESPDGSGVDASPDTTPVVTQLSQNLGTLSFAVTPDSQRVVFISDHNWPYLKSVSIAAGDGILISPTPPAPLPIGYGVRQFSVVDSSNVVFLADTTLDKPTSLYFTAAAGGEIVLLSAEYDVVSYRVANEARFVAFGVENGGKVELYRTRLVNPFISVLGAHNTLAEPTSYESTPRGLHLLHLGPGADGPRQLIVTDIVAGDQLTLDDGEGQVQSFRVNAPSTRVVYLTTTALGGQALSSIALDASGRAPLLSGTNAETAETRVLQYQIAPDGNHVVYLANLDAPQEYRLYHRNIVGGSQTTLSPGTDGLAVRADLIRFTPDSTRVVFAAVNRGEFQLYVVPTGGGEALALLPSGVDALVAPSKSPALLVSNSYVVFNASSDGSLLYRVALTGGTPLKLTDNLVVDETQSILLDARERVYFLRRAPIGAVQLLSAALGDGATTRISPNETVELDVQRFLLSPDGAYIVFGGDLAVIGQLDLLSATLP